MDSTLLKVQMHFTPFGRGKFLPQCMWQFIKNGKISFGKCHEFPKRKEKPELHLQELQTLPFAIGFYKVFFFLWGLDGLKVTNHSCPVGIHWNNLPIQFFFNFLVQLKITMYFMRKRFQLGFVTLSSKVYHEYKWRLSTFGFWMLDFDCWL